MAPVRLAACKPGLFWIVTDGPGDCIEGASIAPSATGFRMPAPN